MNEQKDEWHRLRKEARQFFGKEGAAKWMVSPHPLLGGEEPGHAVLDGRAHQVEALLDQLRSGAVV